MCMYCDVNCNSSCDCCEAFRDAIERVRELHSRKDWDVCPVCIVWDEEQSEYVCYSNPCPTIKALDGEWSE